MPTIPILRIAAAETLTGSTIDLLAPGYQGEVTQLEPAGGGRAEGDRLPLATAAANADVVVVSQMKVNLQPPPQPIEAGPGRGAASTPPKPTLPKRAGAEYAVLQTDEDGYSHGSFRRERTPTSCSSCRLAERRRRRGRTRTGHVGDESHRACRRVGHRTGPQRWRARHGARVGIRKTAACTPARHRGEVDSSRSIGDRLLGTVAAVDPRHVQHTSSRVRRLPGNSRVQGNDAEVWRALPRGCAAHVVSEP